MNQATKAVRVYLMNDRDRCSLLITAAEDLGRGDALHAFARSKIIDVVTDADGPKLAWELIRAALLTVNWDQATSWVWDHVKEGT